MSDAQEISADAERSSHDEASFRYALVDLAVAASLRPIVAGLPSSAAVPLLSPQAPRSVHMVGPWLVRLSKAPNLVQALASIAPGTPWGYYVHSGVDIVSLRQALRRFNLATFPDSRRPVLFRYWDPRVIEVFLEVADRSQRERFFEWISRVEDAGGRFDARAT